MTKRHLKLLVISQMVLTGCLPALVPLAHGAEEVVEANSAAAESTGASGDQAADTGTEETLSTARSEINSHELGKVSGSGVIYPLGNISINSRTDVYDDDGSNNTPSLDWLVGGGFQGENRGHLYGVEAFVQGGYYLSGGTKQDDKTAVLSLYWGTAFTTRSNLDAGIMYRNSYDPRSAEDPVRNIRQTIDESEPDKWQETQAGVTYQYGASEARGRVKLDACLTCRDYENNEQAYRDRDDTDLGLTFFTRVGPRTDAFVQIVFSDFDYVNESISGPTLGRSLDSEELRYMVGTTWNATSRATGRFRIGLVEKEFADSSREKYEAVSWDADFSWSPTAKDQLNAGLRRSPSESIAFLQENPELGNLVEVHQLDMTWSHRWTNKVTTNVDAYAAQDDFQPSTRQDNRWGVAAGFYLDLPKFGRVGLALFHQERNAGFNDYSYSDDGISIHFDIGRIFGLGSRRTQSPEACDIRRFSSSGAYF